ncbi:type I secretion system permease/ATPase [Acidovorax sp. D2M1]|uniref:Type I secretion system permease/ATPase n=1 Tax=Acidovorax benzenivorans TaxID=2987520 RepID=A0ABT5RR48_9BURK|nr:type I secretion system permease/ATPase [Acidovorax benzenivorans]MDD2176172.1 type I secretion system permease/ATPase [Acidovorax benzenivorans]
MTAPAEVALALARRTPALRRAFVFSVLAGVLVLVPTVYMFEVYGRVVDSRNTMTLAMLTLMALLALAVMEVLEWVRSETLREAGSAFDAQLAPRVFEATQSAYLKKGLTLGTQPLADLRTLRDTFHGGALAAALESPVALVALVALFLIQPVLGWVALALALVQALISWLNERSTAEPLARANQADIQARTYVDGTLRHAEVVAALGMAPDLQARWLRLHREAMALQARASDNAGLYQALGRGLQTTLSSALLGLGAWLLLRDELPGGGGMLIVSSVLGARVLSPLVQLVSQWRQVVQARLAWQRLSDLLERLPAGAPSMSLPAPRGHVAVEGLTASASAGGPPMLRQISFSLQPGEVIAVIGPSASGKTTLARMLVGLWPPLAGNVRLDGADVSAWNKEELGPHLGYLPQSVELLAGTLGENIARFGEPDAGALQEAARAVGLHDWITALPQGYDTPVGDEGVMLSGGQRQRVALARALYGAPAFVVLDEPNASLDEAGNQALGQAIAHTKARGATVVVMTHLPGVLAVADKALVLFGGAQRAFGPRDEVLAALQKANQNNNSVATAT